jgi:DNA-binding NarL/FixJ family response regulator
MSDNLIPGLCSIVVGRDAELTTISRYLAEPRGRSLFITGEAGIGKTRLVRETAVRGSAAGRQVLEGRCFEADRQVPFAPIQDLLRAGLSQQSEDGEWAEQELIVLLPELHRSRPQTPETSEIDERRLFAALARVMARKMAQQPLLLVFEDLHWCDDASLAFLRYLTSRLPSSNLALVMTFREEEVTDPLRELVADLIRQRAAVELKLSRLNADEVGLMMTDILSGPSPRTDDVQMIADLTDGNPLFVEEVLKSVIDSPPLSGSRVQGTTREIPSTVQSAVQRRTRGLSSEAQRLIEVAAVAGRRFDFELLLAVTGLDEPGLVTRIKELIAAQLVVEEATDTYAFRHALTQRAIYDMMLGHERRLMHLAVGEVLEGLANLRRSDQLGDLGVHFFEAQVWSKALRFARLAGDQALSLYSPAAAIEHYNRAMLAAKQLGESTPVELLRARGLAYQAHGDFGLARDDLDAALARARATSDGPSEWQVLLDLGFLCLGRAYEEAGQFFQEALRTAERQDDSIRIAQSLNRLGNWLGNMERPREAESYHLRALAIYERMGDQRGLAETCDLLAILRMLAADLVGSAAYYRRAITLFRELDDRPHLVSALATLGAASGTCESELVGIPDGTPLAEATKGAREAVALARAIGQRDAEAYAQEMLGLNLGARGEYAGAWPAARQGLAIAEDIEHGAWQILGHCLLGLLFHDILAFERAERHLARAHAMAQAHGSGHWPRFTAAFLALTLVANNDLTRAERVIEGAVAGATTPNTFSLRLLWSAKAHLALARHDSDEVLARTDEVFRGDLNHPGNDISCMPRLARVRAAALSAQNHHAEAENLLRAARAVASARGALPLIWRVDVALGQLYRTARRHAEAQQAFAQARALIDRLAAGLHDAELRMAHLERAGRVLPEVRQPTQRRAVQAEFDGLTAREREVAALIAGGASNREVADLLVLSERTVTTHVSNVLSKLGFTSRSQIAAWAASKGLPRPI